MRRFRFLVLTAAVGALANAQPLAYTISTIAGGSTAFDFAEGKQATSILLSGFARPAADKQGNLYFSLGHRVVRVAPDGTTKTFAGTGQAGYAGEGTPATSALLNGPGSVVLDPQGRLVIFDIGNDRIRRVEVNGTITTLAGNGQAPQGPMDGEGGLATAARIHSFEGSYDSAGNLFFIDFPGDNRSYIRRIGTDNRITTIVNGAGVFPDGIVSDGTNVYVSDVNPAVNRVARITGSTLTAITGTAVGYGGDTRPSNGASLRSPVGVATDSQGNLHIVDTGNVRVRTIRNNPPSATVASGLGIINTSAGTGTAGFGEDNQPAASSPLSSPSTITVDAADNIIVSDNGSGRYRHFKLNGTITTVAGLSLNDPLGDGGQATQATLLAPQTLFRNLAGNLIICSGGRLRKVAADGTIATIAGRGPQGVTLENIPAIQAYLVNPSGVAQDSVGNLFFVDGPAVWKISPDGLLTRVIGTPGATGDEGPAAGIGLSQAFSLVFDAQDNLYIGSQNAVRKMLPSGLVTRVAGTNQFTQTPLPLGTARNTSLAGPRGLALDGNGNLYIADTFDQRILKVTPDGQFTTFAGTFGKSGFTGDGGPAAQALLAFPTGLAFDAWGNLFVADSQNHRVRKIAPDGTISTIAGSGTAASIKDGDPAVNGQVSPAPAPSLTVDPAGNLTVIDGNRARVLTPDKLRAAGVLHAVTQVAGPVVAGLRIVIRGTELIPPGASTDAVQVLFDGQPATFVSGDGNQITAVVPAAVAGQASTQMQLSIRGALTNALTLPVVAARPGILSILNADLTPNGDAAPAVSGSIVVLQVTGDGNADPSTITVSIGGIAANIVHGPPVDGLPGVRSIAVQLPDGTMDGAPVVLAIGDAQSQDGVVLRVQQ